MSTDTVARQSTGVASRHDVGMHSRDRLPPALGARDLPLAELTAARLDGELFALGDRYCSIAELETPALRAAAALGSRPARLIAELGTAAWIWGAAPVQPTTWEFCSSIGHRARLARTDPAQVRDLVLDPGDVTRLGAVAVAVTTPLRTAVDLARFRIDLSPDDGAAIRRLLVIGRVSPEDVHAMLDRRRNLPGKRRARDVLTGLLGPESAISLR